MMTVNGQRLQAHLEALADIARTPDGICRLSYSDSFWKSNAYVAQLMREAGMSVTTNPVGNVVGTYPGRSPRKITIGSHIDSVVNGGIFDGCLGVLAGIEAVHTLSENGIVPEHSIDVVSFAEEEGIVITGLIGSRAYCGLPPTEPVLEKMGGSSDLPFRTWRRRNTRETSITPLSCILSRAVCWSPRRRISAWSARSLPSGAISWSLRAWPITPARRP